MSLYSGAWILLSDGKINWRMKDGDWSCAMQHGLIGYGIGSQDVYSGASSGEREYWKTAFSNVVRRGQPVLLLSTWSAFCVGNPESHQAWRFPKKYPRDHVRIFVLLACSDARTPLILSPAHTWDSADPGRR